MFKAAVAGAIALSATTGAALADDSANWGTYDWSGLWIGGHAGGVAGKITGPFGGQFMGGTDAGVHAYYNFALHDGWIFGPYVAVPLAPALGNSGSLEYKTTWAVVGGARLGYAADRIMPYVLAAAIVGGGQVSDGSSTTGQTHTGYTLGGGIDIAIHDKVSAGVRYAHVWINEKGYSPTLTGPFGWDADSFVFTLNFKLK